VNRPAAPRHTPIPAPDRADRWIGRAAGVTVAGLAGIAGAISYSHMRQLAAAHGDAGWHAHAFPLSVDGVEIVASLVLLADRRTGRRSGWLPWAALAVGTAASLAANIATADADTVSRIIAGWPALALLIAVKLLSGILEHRPPAPVPDLAPDAGTGGPGGGQARPQAAPAPDRQAATPGDWPDPAAYDGAGRRARRGSLAAPADDIAPLLPAARAIRDELHLDGYPLTRDALAAGLRQAGYQVRNARLTALLHSLRDEPASLTLNGRH